MREGSLDAPIRHALDWQNPWFWDEKALEKVRAGVEELVKKYPIYEKLKY